MGGKIQLEPLLQSSNPWATTGFMKLFGTSNIKYFVSRYFQNLGDLSGNRVIDIPAGSGFMTNGLCVELEKSQELEAVNSAFFKMHNPDSGS